MQSSSHDCFSSSGSVHTIPSLLSVRADEDGCAAALTVSGVTYTYAQLLQRVSTMGGALQRVGVRQGDAVVVLSNNRIEMVEVILGCVWIGAVAVPVNPELRGDGLASVLGQSGAEHVFTEPVHTERVVGAGYRGRLWDLGPGGRSTLTIGESVPAASVDPLETAMVLFTSGTTGTPKGVRCPHSQFVHWGVGVGEALELTADDVLFNCLPFFHTNAIGAMFQAFATGAEFVLGSRFSAGRHWTHAAEAGATVTYLLGAMVAILMSTPESPRDRSHTVTRALAPGTPAHLHAEFLTRFGVGLVDGYGSTETNYAVGCTVSHSRPGFLGTVRPGYEAIVLDGGESVPDGSPGELVLRTLLPGAFATGYLDGPTPPPNSWRRTGDRVVRDPDGWFRFIDRIKDVIRYRGENVSSLEVERVLRRHVGVAQVAVFPVPSSLAEDEVMAAVVPREGFEIDPAQLLREAEQHLAYFAVPRFVDVVDSLPLTDTGKVKKAELTLKGVGPRTWDAEQNDYKPVRVIRPR